jgi:aconitate hydratase
MGKNVAQKLIESHLLDGSLETGKEIAIKIDQTLTQDATGTLVMLELEAMGLKKAQTEVSCQYVDHNMLQTDFKNAEDHLFLQSACQRFGLWYSRAGNGVSHPVHMERFGKPGKTLLGSDSHTPAAGSLGMLAIGAGGLEVALAIAGKPFYFKMPKIKGIKLVGKLPEWVSAKDVILELLRRHDVSGGVGYIFEYFGPGLENLTAMDRHVIANMGAELGATTSVFPSDHAVKNFLESQGRGDDFVELIADVDATYDEEEEIDLSKLEPLIALPSSPGKVVAVRKVTGTKIYQSMVGSSANPGYRDFAMAAAIVDSKKISPQVSFDINPTSRQIFENLTTDGYLAKLIHSGARIHESGCNGCIGMGQAPAIGKASLRTVPRNFPGRSGTDEDQVYLCSPEVAAASALTGVITDPRRLDIPYPKIEEPKSIKINKEMLLAPLEDGSMVELIKGVNIKPIPVPQPLDEEFKGPLLIKLNDNISTDDILPAGSNVLPFRSNIYEISKFIYERIDPTYHQRALEHQKEGHFIIGGFNYGQGSSREHAALVPSYLGVKAVITKSWARIHRSNLINFGILPLTFKELENYDSIELGNELRLRMVRECLINNEPLILENLTKNESYAVEHNLSERQIEILLAGGILGYHKFT